MTPSLDAEAATAFDEWLYGVEGYGLRAERLSEDLRDPLDKVLPWLRAAFEVGCAAAPTPDVHCFECQTELVGPLCPECNPEIRAALSWKAPTHEGMREKVALSWQEARLAAQSAVVTWLVERGVDYGIAHDTLCDRIADAITEGRGR